MNRRWTGFIWFLGFLGGGFGAMSILNEVLPNEKIHILMASAVLAYLGTTSGILPGTQRPPNDPH